MPQTAASLTRKQLTLAEIGLIVSLLLSIGATVFTAGILWGQVQDNERRIQQIEPKVNLIEQRLERIDTNLEYIKEAQRINNAVAYQVRGNNEPE